MPHIATTTNIKFELFQKAHHLWYTPYNSLTHSLTHHNDGQEQYWRLQQIITSALVIHNSCSGRAKPDIISAWWAFYFTSVGERMTRVDHFGDCFVRVRPVNRLFSCRYQTFGQISGLSTYFSFSLAFYFAIILITIRSLCTLQLYHLQDGDRGVYMLPTWRRSDKRDVGTRNRLSKSGRHGCWSRRHQRNIQVDGRKFLGHFKCYSGSQMSSVWSR